MGGSSGGTSVQHIAAQAPDVFNPVAPERTAPEAMPEHIDEAGFTTGAKRTNEEKKQKSLGTSRLVIPLENTGTTQAGGYTKPKTPSSVV
jgi:hypothetical protein